LVAGVAESEVVVGSEVEVGVNESQIPDESASPVSSAVAASLVSAEDDAEVAYMANYVMAAGSTRLLMW
jgi:hypothetical protein